LLLDLVELLGEAYQSLFDLLMGDEGDIFVDEIESCLDIGQQFDCLGA
jgi:hypothetical protein